MFWYTNPQSVSVLIAALLLDVEPATPYYATDNAYIDQTTTNELVSLDNNTTIDAVKNIHVKDSREYPKRNTKKREYHSFMQRKSVIEEDPMREISNLVRPHGPLHQHSEVTFLRENTLETKTIVRTIERGMSVSGEGFNQLLHSSQSNLSRTSRKLKESALQYVPRDVSVPQMPTMLSLGRPDKKDENESNNDTASEEEGVCILY